MGIVLEDSVSAQQLASMLRPTMSAVPVETAPTLDGEVLNDPAWAGVRPTSGFVQRTPDEGEPASERTEVYIGYTDDTLYFGVVCYDRDPGRIIVADSRYNDIDLPWGAFETNLGRLRLSYSFTTQILLQALIQYNDRDDIWAANLRFAWLRTANSGLYVVYNENQDIRRSELGWTRKDRSLIVKYSYLFDLLK